MRKVRKDSKLHGLAKEQRALVDKWLFDKGLTYQEVSEACLTMFGLKVSKSSVGRYHEREARGKVKRVSGKVGRWVSEGRALTLDEMYLEELRLMTVWALEEMKWPVEDERDVKTVLRFMRVLIASRRERNEENMMKLAREKFEMKAAKECFNYLKTEEARERVRRREEAKWRVASGEERSAGSGRKGSDDGVGFPGWGNKADAVDEAAGGACTHYYGWDKMSTEANKENEGTRMNLATDGTDFTEQAEPAPKVGKE